MNVFTVMSVFHNQAEDHVAFFMGEILIEGVILRLCVSIVYDHYLCTKLQSVLVFMHARYVTVSKLLVRELVYALFIHKAICGTYYSRRDECLEKLGERAFSATTATSQYQHYFRTLFRITPCNKR